MASMIFEPYATRIHWAWSSPEVALPWESLLTEFLDSIARRCEDAGGLIGHIKALATFGSGQYLRLNIVSAARCADVAGKVPEGCREVVLSLNVLVYGVAGSGLRRIAEDVAAGVASRVGNGLIAMVEPPVDRAHHDHEHEDDHDA